MLLRIRLAQRPQATLSAYARHLMESFKTLRHHAGNRQPLNAIGESLDRAMQVIDDDNGNPDEIWSNLTEIDRLIECHRLSAVKVERHGDLLAVRLPPRSFGKWTTEPWEVTDSYPAADEIFIRSGGRIVAHWNQTCSGNVIGMETGKPIQIRCRADDVWGSWVEVDLTDDSRHEMK